MQISNTVSLAVSCTDLAISAGGKLTVQGSGTGQAIANSGSGTTSLTAKGDVQLSTENNQALASGNTTVSGANVTMTSTGNSPTVSCSSLKVTATGNVKVEGAKNMALSAYNGVEITADGSITVKGAGTSPAVSTGKAVMKAKKAVVIENPNYGLAISGETQVEGSSVTVNAGSGMSVFSSPVSLKATEGNVTVTSTETQSVMFSAPADKVELYAAEEIKLTIASAYVCDGMPKVTFGKCITMGDGKADGESLFIGLTRVAVEDGTDYLPQLKIKMNGEAVDATFTAKLNDKDQTNIKTAGTYACEVKLDMSTMAAEGQSVSFPFNLIVRKAKPAVTPATGDEAPLAVLAMLTVASVLGMGVMITCRKRR